MQLRIAQPIGFSKPGGRPANEDTLFPDPQMVTADQAWFMVCDGVGGATRGEVASQLAVRQFDAYFRNNPVRVATADYVQRALTTVQDQFDAYVAANPSAAGMGTTLTLVYIHEAGLTVAHLGDSRVYLVRNGRIEWRTDDHSYVNELIKGGVLTADEARHHPQRNIITRAIQSSDTRPVVDVQLISDLHPGDYLFLCSDGVLERVSDELLENVLGSTESNQEKMQILEECCTDQTRDNFTAYLLQITAISGNSLPGYEADLPPYERPEPALPDEVTVVALSHPNTPPYPAHAVRAEAVPDLLVTKQLDGLLSNEPEPVRGQSSFKTIMSVLTIVLVVLGGYVGWKVLGQPGWTRTSETSTNKADLLPLPRSERVMRPTPVSSMSVPKSVPERATTPTSEAEPVLPATPATRPAIDRAVQGGLYVGVADGKRGLLLADRMTWLIPAQFDKIGSFQDGIAKVTVGGQPKYLSLKGHVYDEIGPPHCDRIRVRANDKWGYLNLNGEVAIGVRYPKASSFRDDCTADVYIGTQPFRIDRVGRDVKTGRGPVATISR